MSTPSIRAVNYIPAPDYPFGSFDDPETRISATPPNGSDRCLCVDSETFLNQAFEDAGDESVWEGLEHCSKRDDKALPIRMHSPSAGPNCSNDILG